MFDLSVSFGAKGPVFSFGALNCPGAEGTDLSRVKSGGVGDVNIIQLAGERDTLKALRNKHHSLGENGEIFLEQWCLCLSAPVLIV